MAKLRKKRWEEKLENWPTIAEVKWNTKMCQFYPLGRVDAIWTLFDSFYSEAHQAQAEDEKEAIENVLDALEKYDNILRAKLKKKVK